MIEESLREVATGKGALAGLDHHQTREPRESCCARQVLIPTHISQHLHQTTTHEKRMKVFFSVQPVPRDCVVVLSSPVADGG